MSNEFLMPSGNYLIWVWCYFPHLNLNFLFQSTEEEPISRIHWGGDTGSSLGALRVGQSLSHQPQSVRGSRRDRNPHGRNSNAHHLQNLTGWKQIYQVEINFYVCVCVLIEFTTFQKLCCNLSTCIFIGISFRYLDILF